MGPDTTSIIKTKLGSLHYNLIEEYMGQLTLFIAYKLATDCLQCCNVIDKLLFIYFPDLFLHQRKKKLRQQHSKQFIYEEFSKKTLGIDWTFNLTHLQQILTVRVTILSNSIAGAMWKSNTKYWWKKNKKAIICQHYL